MMLAHPFCFMISPRESGRAIRSFQQRDLAAMMELLGALSDEGFTLGESILNFPPGDGREPAERTQVDPSHLNPGDLILSCTRPPIHDAEHGNKKQVLRGYTDLEDEIFGAWKRYLRVLARTHVRLSERLWPQLEGPYRTRRDMSFYSTGQGAFYRDWNDCEESGWQPAPRLPHTAGFVLRLGELYPGGPGYCGVFGMDGVVTYILCWLLRHRRGDLLRDPGFRMLELRGGDIPERPTDLDWIDRWKIHELLRAG